MEISEMLYDAAKYPLSRLKQLLLLGLMILIISFFLGDYNELYIYFQGIFGDIALLLLLFIMLGFLIAVLFSFLEAGYTFKVIEKSVQGIEKPPKLNNFISMFKHGFNEIIILITYFSVPFILLITVLDTVFTEISLGLPTISTEITLLLLIVVVLLGFLADIIFKVAIPHMAFKGGALKEAFNFSEIFMKIKQIGLKKLLIGYIIVVVGLVVIGWPILKEIIESTNIFGFLIAEKLIAPYIILFSARFTALIYRS